MLVLLIATGILLAIGVFFLVQSYWGYTYKHMPLSAKLLEYKKGLFKYYKACGKSDADAIELSEQDFAADLDAVYATNCEANGENNDSKSSNIFRANLYIIGSIVSVALCGLIFLWLSKTATVQPAKIEITNFKELTYDQQQRTIKPASTTGNSARTNTANNAAKP